MEERTVTPERSGPPGRPVGADRPSLVHRYRLGLDTALSLVSDGDRWLCRPERNAGGGIRHEEWIQAEEGDGAAQAFVDLLRYEALPPVPAFRVLRLVPPPEATGERAFEPDETPPSAVVVGERVVVTWTLRAADSPHPGPLTLEHLAEHNFLGVPDTYGLLLWRTPSGNEVPVAAASRYLPRSRTGWDWLGDVLDAAAGGVPDARSDGSPGTTGTAWPEPSDATPGRGLPAADLPTRLGRLVAKLHLTLSTPSAVLPVPASRVDGDTVRGWHAAALDAVDAAEVAVRASTGGGPLGLTQERLVALRAAIDLLQEVADDADGGGEADPGDPDGVPASGVEVQRVHGDLHLGRVLRWPGGLAVVGFDAQPVEPGEQHGLRLLPAEGGELQPAARDLARLLASVDELVRRRAGAAAPGWAQGRDWAERAREEILDAYRAEAEHAGRPELLDERLLAAFEAEQVCRDAVRERIYELDGS